MSHPDIVLIAGSPSDQSRSSLVLRALAERWRNAGLSSRQFSVREFAPEALLFARFDAPGTPEFLAAVQGARALVLASPVYKASYSGVLKTIVDLIPLDALRSKVALGVATAKLETHAPAVSTAYGELFGFFGVRSALPTLYLLDAQLPLTDGKLQLDAATEARIDAAAGALRAALDGA